MSAHYPCPYCVSSDARRPVRARTNHIDDILGCGEDGSADLAREYLARHFGAMGIQETNFAHVGNGDFARERFLSRYFAKAVRGWTPIITDVSCVAATATAPLESQRNP